MSDASVSVTCAPGCPAEYVPTILPVTWVTWVTQGALDSIDREGVTVGNT